MKTKIMTEHAEPATPNDAELEAQRVEEQNQYDERVEAINATSERMATADDQGGQSDGQMLCQEVGMLLRFRAAMLSKSHMPSSTVQFQGWQGRDIMLQDMLELLWSKSRSKL